MSETTFGERLRTAFGNANNTQIASKLGVGPSTIVNYLAGRIPEWKIVFKIKEVTGCDLDWLLTGAESRRVHGLPAADDLTVQLRSIASEQAHVVYDDAEIAGHNIEERTLQLLVEYLLSRAMASFNLIDEDDLLSAADRKRAARFTFNANVPGSVDERIRALVAKEVAGKGVSQIAQGDEIRAMIRDIVKEEVATSRKRPVFPLNAAGSDEIEETTRRKKAG